MKAIRACRPPKRGSGHFAGGGKMAELGSKTLRGRVGRWAFGETTGPRETGSTLPIVERALMW